MSMQHAKLPSAAVMLSTVVIGILMERMVVYTYGEAMAGEDEFSVASLPLALATFGATSLGSRVARRYQNLPQPETKTFNWRGRLVLGFISFLAFMSQVEALRALSYSTVVLYRCAISIVAFGVLLRARSSALSGRFWLAAGATCLGLFTYSSSRIPRRLSKAGIALLAFNFLCETVKVWLQCPDMVHPVLELPTGKAFGLSLDFEISSASFFMSVFCMLCAVVTRRFDFQPIIDTPVLWRDLAILMLLVGFVEVTVARTYSSHAASKGSTTWGSFISIFVNACVFKHLRPLRTMSWLGVFWVAAGVFYRYDQPSEEAEAFYSLGEDDQISEDCTDGEKMVVPYTSQARRPLFHYAAIALLPLLAAPLLTAPVPYLPTTFPFSLLYPSTTPYASVRLKQVRLPYDVDAHIEGGKWEQELHSAVQPSCIVNFNKTIAYHGKFRTAFVSVPRSGNSYLRTLVERVTGYQTNSVYCDHSLAPTFLGECQKKRFFVKTHFPCLPSRLPKDWETYYYKYHQAVLVVRNPLDALASWWHLAHSRTEAGLLNHEKKIELAGGKFGKQQRVEMIHYARRWRDHALYWQNAPIQMLEFRYEDFRRNPVAKMIKLLSFILPDEDAPPIEDVACMVESVDRHLPYKSRKSSDFASWDLWEPELRQQILHLTREPFCHFGYDRLLKDVLGDLPEMDRFCDKLKDAPPRDPFENFGQAWHGKKEKGWQDY